MDDQANPDVVKAAWVLGVSIVLSSLIIGVGAIGTAAISTRNANSAVQSAADRTATAIERASAEITAVVNRTFADPLQLQVGTTVAMPQPVTIKGPASSGGQIETEANVDLFGGGDEKDKDKKGQ